MKEIVKMTSISCEIVVQSTYRAPCAARPPAAPPDRHCSRLHACSYSAMHCSSSARNTVHIVATFVFRPVCPSRGLLHTAVGLLL